MRAVRPKGEQSGEAFIEDAGAGEDLRTFMSLIPDGYWSRLVNADISERPGAVTESPRVRKAVNVGADVLFKNIEYCTINGPNGASKEVCVGTANNKLSIYPSIRVSRGDFAGNNYIYGTGNEVEAAGVKWVNEWGKELFCDEYGYHKDCRIPALRDSYMRGYNDAIYIANGTRASSGDGNGKIYGPGYPFVLKYIDRWWFKDNAYEAPYRFKGMWLGYAQIDEQDAMPCVASPTNVASHSGKTLFQVPDVRLNISLVSVAENENAIAPGVYEFFCAYVYDNNQVGFPRPVETYTVPYINIDNVEAGENKVFKILLDIDHGYLITSSLGNKSWSNAFNPRLTGINVYYRFTDQDSSDATELRLVASLKMTSEKSHFGYRPPHITTESITNGYFSGYSHNAAYYKWFLYINRTTYDTWRTTIYFRGKGGEYHSAIVGHQYNKYTDTDHVASYNYGCMVPNNGRMYYGDIAIGKKPAFTYRIVRQTTGGQLVEKVINSRLYNEDWEYAPGMVSYCAQNMYGDYTPDVCPLQGHYKVLDMMPGEAIMYLGSPRDNKLIVVSKDVYELNIQNGIMVWDGTAHKHVGALNRKLICEAQNSTYWVSYDGLIEYKDGMIKRLSHHIQPAFQAALIPRSGTRFTSGWLGYDAYSKTILWYFPTSGYGDEEDVKQPYDNLITDNTTVYTALTGTNIYLDVNLNRIFAYNIENSGWSERYYPVKFKDATTTSDGKLILLYTGGENTPDGNVSRSWLYVYGGSTSTYSTQSENILFSNKPLPQPFIALTRPFSIRNFIDGKLWKFLRFCYKSSVPIRVRYYLDMSPFPHAWKFQGNTWGNTEYVQEVIVDSIDYEPQAVQMVTPATELSDDAISMFIQFEFTIPPEFFDREYDLTLSGLGLEYDWFELKHDSRLSLNRRGKVYVPEDDPPDKDTPPPKRTPPPPPGPGGDPETPIIGDERTDILKPSPVLAQAPRDETYRCPLQVYPGEEWPPRTPLLSVELADYNPDEPATPINWVADYGGTLSLDGLGNIAEYGGERAFNDYFLYVYEGAETPFLVANQTEESYYNIDGIEAIDDTDKVARKFTADISDKAYNLEEYQIIDLDNFEYVGLFVNYNLE